MEENRVRSLVKATSWRITGTVDTMIISYFVTGEMTFAVSIGLIELCTKMGLYYLHERIWNKINLGRKIQQTDYQI